MLLVSGCATTSRDPITAGAKSFPPRICMKQCEDFSCRIGLACCATYQCGPNLCVDCGDCLCKVEYDEE